MMDERERDPKVAERLLAMRPNSYTLCDPGEFRRRPKVVQKSLENELERGTLPSSSRDF